MLLAACRDMSDEERQICTKYMIKGFQDACKEAQTSITGGQTVLNPWPIIGGVATSIVSKGEFVPSDGATIGNVVVLTKPLGTQIAVNVYQWKSQNNKHWKKCVVGNVINDDDANTMMHYACQSMARLNKNAGSLMIKYNATAATDVTGFGILGHSQNLIENQASPDRMSMILHTLPLIEKTKEVNDHIFNFRLTVGYSAETSGGLLICFPNIEDANGYIKELESLDQTSAWIVGNIVEGSADSAKNMAKLADDVKFLEVTI